MEQKTASKKRELTVCEEQVMKVLWDSDTELTLPEITERVNRRYGYDWKPQTVSTFLARLYKKGYTIRARAGRTFYHIPAKNNKEFMEKQVRHILEDWYDGDKDKLIQDIRNI